MNEASDPELLRQMFIEICPPIEAPQHRSEDRIEVWTTFVQPHDCASLLKEMSESMDRDETLAHLKRVKQPQRREIFDSRERAECSDASVKDNINSSRTDDNECNNSTHEPATKKPKRHTRSNAKGINQLLQVLLGRIEDKDRIDRLVGKYNLVLEPALVPGRSAESKEELLVFNSIWPTIFFERKSNESKEQQKQLTDDEVKQMLHGMHLVLEDDHESAIIMDPSCHGGAVVSRSREEWLLQQPSMGRNPLSTPVLLALQGVSRKERMSALGHGLASNEFRQGQYLCTGYDIFLNKEPSVYEAMALVHSRMRRVIFSATNDCDGGLGGTGAESAVHCLPATNHRYRVFMYSPCSTVQNAS